MSKTSEEIRSAFLEFFRAKGHQIVESGPLVPANDPTLMFANAGMVQFKDVFTGKETRPYARATSSQKCIRISGKHNDLENVGVTARHHTFFEMLGNFSFGDYFKEDAIAFAWELVTKVYGVDTDKLVVTIFGGDPKEPTLGPDDEARAIWKKVTGWGDDRIIGLGLADNFWQMGDTGPCGPCSEIHFFNGDAPDYARFGDEPTADGRGWMEIWNNVFMQFERRAVEGGGFVLDPLPKPSVDTGMGLERISSVLQGKTTNYDTDLLRALVDKASELSGKAYRGSQGDDDVSMRVIADHARTTAFLIAEGVFPDRAGREYVLRRVMRRAIRHGHRLGIAQPFLHEVALEVVRTMGGHYPELAQRKDLIATVTEQEEVRFRETIGRGLKILDDEIATLKTSGKAMISGETAFKLYDTYGFPRDLTEVIAAERELGVDGARFDTLLDEQRKRSEGSKVGEVAVEEVWRTVLEQLKTQAQASAGDAAGASGVRFVGYEREDADAKIVAIVKGGALAAHASEGDEVTIVTDVTPFYGEAGGQVGDQGTIVRPRGEPMTFAVSDTQKPIAGLFAHVGKLTQGEVSVGDAVYLEVDHARRTATRRNHSATHLLHWALRTVLGEQATQKGSLVASDRLRFDFSHNKALTPHELTRIEDLVNTKILGNAPIGTEVLPIDVAKQKGAVAIFEEKYGDVVRVLTMTSDSVELCGGTHARALGEIGLFKILSEGGLAAGVRRIEAATGLNALVYLRQVEQTNVRTARILGAGLNQVAERAEKLLAEKKSLEKEVAELKKRVAIGGSSVGASGPSSPGGAASSGSGAVASPTDHAKTIPGGRALAQRIEVADAATLRQVAEQWRDKLGPSVVLVGAASKDKAMLVLTVSKELTSRYHAGNLIKALAQIVGGSGGGRPDMAQAGGTEIGRLDEALQALYGSLTAAADPASEAPAEPSATPRPHAD